MAKQKKDLGKGIRALISGIDSEPKAKPQVTPTKQTSANALPIGVIEANPYQPRQVFEEEDLEALKASIRVHGIIQPITVKRIAHDKYYIISGERRYRAAKEIGLEEVPVFIREAGDQEMLEMALIENIQRADLNPIDIAISYQRLMNEFNITHEMISSRVGKKRSTITNYIRLLKLAPVVQEALRNEKITMGHAKVLAGIENADRQLVVLEAILSQQLSVRQAEALTTKKSSSKPSSRQSSPTQHDSQMRKIIDGLSEKFGSKVKLTRSKNGKGKIEVNFNSDDHLNHILDNILD